MLFFMFLISFTEKGENNCDEMKEIEREKYTERRKKKKEINERKRDTMGEGPGWGTGLAVL